MHSNEIASELSIINSSTPEVFTKKLNKESSSESMESTEKSITTSTTPGKDVQSNEISSEISNESKEKLPTNGNVNTEFTSKPPTTIKNYEDNSVGPLTTIKIEIHTKISTSKIVSNSSWFFNSTQKMDISMDSTPELSTEHDVEKVTMPGIESSSEKDTQNNDNFSTTLEIDSSLSTDTNTEISTTMKIPTMNGIETSTMVDVVSDSNTMPEINQFISTDKNIEVSTTFSESLQNFSSATPTNNFVDTTENVFTSTLNNAAIPTTLNENIQNFPKTTSLNFVITTENTEFSTEKEIQNFNNKPATATSQTTIITKTPEKGHDVFSELSTKIMEPTQSSKIEPVNTIKSNIDDIPEISTEESFDVTTNVPEILVTTDKIEIPIPKTLFIHDSSTQTTASLEEINSSFLSTERMEPKVLDFSTENIQNTSENLILKKDLNGNTSTLELLDITTPFQFETLSSDAKSANRVLNVTSERFENTSPIDLTVDLLKSTRESGDNERFRNNPSSFRNNDDNLSPRQQFATSESVKTNQELKFNMPNGGVTAGNVICFPNPQQFPGGITFPQQDPNQSRLDFSPRLVTPGFPTSGYSPYTNYYYPMGYPSMYPNYGYYGNSGKDSSFTSQNNNNYLMPQICHMVNYPPIYPNQNVFRKSQSQSRTSQSNFRNDLDDSIIGDSINEFTNNDVLLECSSEKEIACRDGSKCIAKTQWCDSNIDCPDLSDELSCSCKHRVDKSRLCDGFFDCPNGEDELGCFGCPQNEFSCDDWNRHHDEVTCVPLEKRCDGIQQCVTNGKDEMDCSLLAESIFQHQAHLVSLSQGILHHNYRGVWYPVCNSDDKWANEVCLSEVGGHLAPPTIQTIPITSPYTGNFIEGILPSGDASLVKLCQGLTYVECPKIECGTRISMATLRNDDENDILQLSQEENLFRLKRQDERVVGGHASKPAAWPWVIALYRDGVFHCGGVIVNENWIMTAAHCVDKFWQHYYEVQAGMLRRFSFSPMEQIRSVEYVIVHQSYDRSSMKNDLALLRLHSPLAFNRWIRNICLPNIKSAGANWSWGPSPGTACTAVGWGATFEHGPDPDHMREVEVPILATCKHRLDREGAEICAGFEEGGRDACQGDSGGPLLCLNPITKNQWFVAGVVSHGEGCARPDEPGVYTRVAMFIEWIHLNILETSFPQRKPLSHCPGMSCIPTGENNSGKCLSRRKRCDGVVDCLTVEDELNCQDKKQLSKISRQTWESLLMAKYSKKPDENLLKSPEPAIKENKMKSNPSDIVEDYVDDTFMVSQANIISTTSQLDENLSATVITSTNEPVRETSIVFEDSLTVQISTSKPENASEIVPTPDSASQILFENEEDITIPIPVNLIKKSYFQCKRILQNVPIDKKCDKHIDCEDATDEKECTCKDFLQKSHSEAICDGNFDCADGTDESNCYSCPINYFFCEKSLQCIKMTLRCDGKSDCQFNEDEKDCVLLTNAKNIYIHIDGKPKLEKSGYITTLINSTWQPYCNYNLENKNATALAIDVCNNLGHTSFYDHFIRDIHYTPIELIYSNGTKVSDSNINMPLDHTSKNCKALFVRCHIGIFTKLSDLYLGSNNRSLRSYEENNDYFWPWNGIIYVDGVAKCTGTLINVNWILSSQFCIDEITLENNYIIIVFGTGKGYLDIENPYEQIRRVNYISNFANISLMHLETPTNYSRFVKPLPINTKVSESLSKDICVTVGIDKYFNMLKPIFLKPISQNCAANQRCFKQIQKPNDCSNYTYPWSGTVVCFSQISGWYPSAIYHEPNGPCSFIFTKSLTSIISSMNLIVQQLRTKLTISDSPSCTGLRCPLGQCVETNQICDSTTDCRGGYDETIERCESRHLFCEKQTCDCTPDEYKCKNGQCVHKSKFCDGISDCLDRSDETETCACSDYLNQTLPHLICDGIRNCLDKSDEKNCMCTPKSFKCDDSKCILQEFVCDGERDCTNGEDEKYCLALKHNKEHDPLASGEVYIRSSGLWHVKCFPKSNITQIEIENICNKVGFVNGRRIPLEISATSSDGERVIQEPAFDKFQAIRLNKIKILYARLGSNTRPFANLKYVKKQCNIVNVICE
ncbi:serine protease nudel [Chrysoperla carnea]|uniref:serine protease nudel n=1 Tax=Chrysoperla carnea TaxID=189513 RepID=UPI001D095C61|nr:serine protease nudel [Chrysoperla carnea]